MDSIVVDGSKAELIYVLTFTKFEMWTRHYYQVLLIHSHVQQSLEILIRISFVQVEVDVLIRDQVDQEGVVVVL